MNNKKTFLTFSIIAIIYWVCSWLDYGWYMGSIRALSSSQYIFMLIPVVIGIIFAVFYLAGQAIWLNKGASRFGKTKVFLTFLGLSYVCFEAYRVSLIRNPIHQKLLLDIISGHERYPLLVLPRVLMDAEGVDLLFCFVLALISGHIIYSRKVKFDIKGFFVALLIWTFILSIKEVIKHYLPFRQADIGDAIKNMIGGILPGLILSLRWFWSK